MKIIRARKKKVWYTQNKFAEKRWEREKEYRVAGSFSAAPLPEHLQFDKGVCAQLYIGVQPVCKILSYGSKALFPALYDETVDDAAEGKEENKILCWQT